MRLRHIPCLLLLFAYADVGASDVYASLNRLRSGEGPCGATQRLAPLRPQVALERAAADLAHGRGLAQSLAAADYRATHAEVIALRGDGIGARVAGLLASPRYCPQLQDAAATEMGIYLTAGAVWIVIAAPFAPAADMDRQAVGQVVLDLVNRARATARSCGNMAFAAAPPLRWNETLAATARRHATDMARFDYFSHSGRDGSTPAQRVERAGYRYRATGENIAGGQLQAAAAVAGWISSPPHCANLMNSAFTEMGVAYAFERKSKLGIYWAQEFGTPR